MTQNIGEGHFLDDSGEDDSDDDDNQGPGVAAGQERGEDDNDGDLPGAVEDGAPAFLAARGRATLDRRRPNVRGRPGPQDQDDGDADGAADVDGSWLAIMGDRDRADKASEVEALQERVLQEAEATRLKEEEERRAEEAKYADCNYWREGSSLEAQLDIDRLMDEMD